MDREHSGHEEILHKDVLLENLKKRQRKGNFEWTFRNYESVLGLGLRASDKLFKAVIKYEVL
jgi:hypothetical protein